MSIQSINNTSFTGLLTTKKQTKEGNDYTKSNVAKVVGTTVGTAGSAYLAVDLKKDINNGKKTLVETRKQVLDKFFKENSNTPISLKNAKKIFSKSMKCAMATIVAAPLVLGLACGAIVDKCINVGKSHKADKLANIEEKAD